MCWAPWSTGGWAVAWNSTRSAAGSPSARGTWSGPTGNQRYGHWSLLLSWMPLIGDPLTLVAGVMGEPLKRFLLLVSLAKGARYAVLVWLTLGWLTGPGA